MATTSKKYTLTFTLADGSTKAVDFHVPIPAAPAENVTWKNGWEFPGMATKDTITTGSENARWHTDIPDKDTGIKTYEARWTRTFAEVFGEGSAETGFYKIVPFKKTLYESRMEDHYLFDYEFSPNFLIGDRMYIQVNYKAETILFYWAYTDTFDSVSLPVAQNTLGKGYITWYITYKKDVEKLLPLYLWDLDDKTKGLTLYKHSIYITSGSDTYRYHFIGYSHSNKEITTYTELFNTFGDMIGYDNKLNTKKPLCLFTYSLIGITGNADYAIYSGETVEVVSSYSLADTVTTVK